MQYFVNQFIKPQQTIICGLKREHKVNSFPVRAVVGVNWSLCFAFYYDDTSSNPTNT